MSWVGLPATNDTDWASAAFVNQFVRACNERRLWGPFSGVPAQFDEIAVGDDVQRLGGTTGGGGQLPSPVQFGWRGIQEVIEHMCTRFTDPASVPAAVDDDTFERFTLARFREVAGLHPDGFVRKYPREIASTADAGSNGQRARNSGDGRFYDHDGTAWELSADQSSAADLIEAHGRMEAGDYIGPWIFNELQAALQAMTMTHAYTSLGAMEDFFPIAQHIARAPSTYPTASSASLATAKSNAESAWDSATWIQGQLIQYEYAYSRLAGPNSGQYTARFQVATHKILVNSTLPNPHRMRLWLQFLDSSVWTGFTEQDFGLGIGDPGPQLGLVLDETVADSTAWSYDDDLSGGPVEGEGYESAWSLGHTPARPAWPTVDPAGAGQVTASGLVIASEPNLVLLLNPGFEYQ